MLIHSKEWLRKHGSPSKVQSVKPTTPDAPSPAKPTKTVAKNKVKTPK